VGTGRPTRGVHDFAAAGTALRASPRRVCIERCACAM
jgi:hypothetical protein